MVQIKFKELGLKSNDKAVEIFNFFLMFSGIMF